jgi:hypothetical protein
MARIGGRNSWIAVPVGVASAVIVGALVWLSLPMLPVTVAWMGDTLRNASSAQQTPEREQTPAEEAAADGTIDCRTLYPDDLWNELTWQAGSLLNQAAAGPTTQVEALSDALAPHVLVSCDWRGEGDRAIVTTLSRVSAEARTVADAALRGQGFACASDAAALVCTRTRGGVLEEHTLRDDLWLASIESGWQPEDYGRRLDRNVWG